MKLTSWKSARESFLVEAESIRQARDHIGKAAFGRAVDALAKAERIAVSGCGHSGIACRHFAHSLCCIERPARFLSPSEALHGASGFIRKGDALVLASRGGQTAELLPLARIGRQKGAFIIVVTENRASSLALDADVVLRLHVERESDRHNQQGTSSFVVLSAIFDALQVALLEETNFKGEQFALIHPGGAVGHRLAERAVDGRA